jgi:hypothetical protein
MDGYPKTLYPRVGGGSITVASLEQEKRLGGGWVHHPPFVQTNFVGAIDVTEWNPLRDMAKAEADLKEAVGKFDLPKRRGRPPKKVGLPSQDKIS